MSRVSLPNKRVSEVVSLTFDFISVLGVAETIYSQSVTAIVLTGVDATPSAVINGSATASGTKVSQSVTGGVVGVIYSLTAKITTSLSQTLELVGYMAVLPDTA